MAKAKTLADAAGVHLGRILSIDEGGTVRPPMPMAAMALAHRGEAAPTPVAGGEESSGCRCLDGLCHRVTARPTIVQRNQRLGLPGRVFLPCATRTISFRPLRCVAALHWEIIIMRLGLVERGDRRRFRSRHVRGRRGHGRNQSHSARRVVRQSRALDAAPFAQREMDRLPRAQERRDEHFRRARRRHRPGPPDHRRKGTPDPRIFLVARVGLRTLSPGQGRQRELPALRHRSQQRRRRAT